MMQKPAIEQRLFAVLSSILNVPRESLGIDSSRATLDQWDSLKHMSLMLALEEEFHVEFDDEEIGALDSVSALLDALTAKTDGSAA